MGAGGRQFGRADLKARLRTSQRRLLLRQFEAGSLRGARGDNIRLSERTGALELAFGPTQFRFSLADLGFGERNGGASGGDLSLCLLTRARIEEYRR